VAGGGDALSSASGPDFAIGLSWAEGIAAGCGISPRRLPATAHILLRVQQDKLMLHMQHKFVRLVIPLQFWRMLPFLSTNRQEYRPA
jgi:hypothetical protein